MKVERSRNLICSERLIKESRERETKIDRERDERERATVEVANIRCSEINY